MRQTKVIENIKTHSLYSITFFENRAVYETMWKNILKHGRQQMTIRRTRIAWRIHSEYATLTAFTLQQWLYEHSSALRYTYSARLALFFVSFSTPHCHTSCGIHPRCFPSHPNCNAVVYFLFFSYFTLHASLCARRWIVREHTSNKTAATSLHHCSLCIRNMSMTKSIKVYVSCNRQSCFFFFFFFPHNGVKMC